MKTIEIEDCREIQREVTLYYSHKFAGRGGWNISCELEDKKRGWKRTFVRYTTDSEFIDQITDLKAEDATFEEIQEHYHSNFFYRFEEEIAEYLTESED